MITEKVTFVKQILSPQFCSLSVQTTVSPKQIEITQRKKIVAKVHLYPIRKEPDPSNEVKMKEKVFLIFNLLSGCFS